jgi:hypothetical protein
VRRAATLLGAAAIFLVNTLLYGPLFMRGELPFRGSIEGGYAGMARFISAHPNPWGWNPFQYCGLPTQFLYLPALPYLTALFVRVAPSLPPEYAYRLIVSTAACLGPMALFFFVLYFTRDHRWALGVALIYSLFSPSYGLFPQVEKDRGIVQLPWRIQVLAKYGEGPHNTGLMLLPIALIALWWAGKRGGYPRILAAACVLALIPLTNWVSAFSLAVAFVLLLLVAWGEAEFRLWRPLAAAGLAYLFACFWLTPSFVKTIAVNWPADSFGYHLHEIQCWLVVGLIAGVVAIRLLFLRLRGSSYFCFVTLCAFAFGWIATAFYLFGFDTIPESRRYALEFELFLFVALAEAARLTLRSKDQTIRMCTMGSAGLMLLVGLPQVFGELTQGWTKWEPAPAETTLEYRLANWLQQHHPEGRVFASGGLRFRLNSWFELSQVGGGFETGLRNRMPVELAYHVRTAKGLRPGHEAQDMVLQLRALGAQYVVIHGPKSKEYYRDYTHPERLAGVLPGVYHEGDDTIYALPPRPLAHLMTPAELPGKDAPTRPWRLERYVASLEDTGRPSLRTAWRDTGTLLMDGAVPEGMLISVQANADSGWHAFEDGREITIGADNLGFMLLHAAPAATAHIELQYRGTTEQRVMALLSIAASIGAIAFLLWQKRSGSMKTN